MNSASRAVVALTSVRQENGARLRISKKFYGYVYKTTNLVNGKMYIGLHSRSEFDPRYLGSGLLLWKAIKKYGRTKFSVRPLVFEKTVELLNEAEKKIIKRYKKKYGSNRLYNIAEGGYRGGAAGTHMAKRTKNLIIKFLTGRKHSDESKERMRISHLGQIPWTLGNHHSESAKRKVSIANKGRKHTEEAKRKISENNSRHNLGKHLSQEIRDKISETLKMRFRKTKESVMAKKAKAVKKENYIVKSKVYQLIKSQGLRVGGDYVAALSEKVGGYVNASIQKVQADGKKKTLNEADLVA